MAIAVEALGATHVLGVLMPSPHRAAAAWTMRAWWHRTLAWTPWGLPIEPAMRAFDGTLQDVFAEGHADVAKENIQYRIRGALLMALSNQRARCR